MVGFTGSRNLAQSYFSLVSRVVAGFAGQPLAVGLGLAVLFSVVLLPATAGGQPDGSTMESQSYRPGVIRIPSDEDEEELDEEDAS